MILILAGCRGDGAADNDQQSPDALDPGIAEGANDERMLQTEVPEIASVEGLLVVEGFTILEPDDPPPGVASAVTQVPDYRLLVRLVDPEDDILNEAYPDISGRFALDYDGPEINARLMVEFKVEEDLDGDGTGEDMLTHSVPLGLKPGRVAQVSITLTRQETESAPGVPIPDVADQELLPESGEMMIVRFTAQDANGYHNEYYGVLFATGQTVFDQDGDEFLETGDDFVGEDADTDGWIDAYETGYSGPLAAMEDVYIGIVINVDKANQTLTLELESKETLLVLVDPFTPIEPLSATNEFYGELPLDASLIGRQVQVSGLLTADGVLALWIVVLESDPPR
jgi:hypothetical protein